jgi:hypothetical protein
MKIFDKFVKFLNKETVEEKSSQSSINRSDVSSCMLALATIPNNCEFILVSQKAIDDGAVVGLSEEVLETIAKSSPHDFVMYRQVHGEDQCISFNLLDDKNTFADKQRRVLDFCGVPQVDKIADSDLSSEVESCYHRFLKEREKNMFNDAGMELNSVLADYKAIELDTMSEEVSDTLFEDEVNMCDGFSVTLYDKYTEFGLQRAEMVRDVNKTELVDSE